MELPGNARRRVFTRRVGQGSLERPLAQRRLRGTAVAELAVRRLGRLEVAAHDTRRELEQAPLEGLDVVRRERLGDRAVGRLEEAVVALASLGAGAERGKRVDEPLRRVALGHDRFRIGALERIAL